MTQRQSQVKLLSIKKFAEICHTTPRTLRFYEKYGLIAPDSIDPFTKYRSYNPRKAREFLRIKFLQKFDIPLQEIVELHKKDTLDSELKKRIAQAKAELEEKKKQLQFLQTMTDFMFEGNIAKSLHKETIGPYSLFCMRVPKADYNKVDDYKEALKEQAKKLRLPLEDKCLVFYQTTAYQPKSTQMEIAYTCKNTKQLQQDKLPEYFSFKTYPKTNILSYQYIGAYEYVSLVYQKLFDYIFQNDIKLVDNTYDIYDESASKEKSSFSEKLTLAFPIKRVNT